MEGKDGSPFRVVVVISSLDTGLLDEMTGTGGDFLVVKERALVAGGDAVAPRMIPAG